MKVCLLLTVGMVLGMCSLGLCADALVKWDYTANPVSVTENPKAFSPVYGIYAASAFDGYGAQGKRPAAIRTWLQMALPSESAPVSCTIDYGVPVAVSAFRHFFYVPDNLDMRFVSPGPSAFKRVKVSCSDDGETWRQVVEHKDLPADCPQVIPVNADKPARLWRIEVTAMAPGAGMVCSYEIETSSNGIPGADVADTTRPDLPAQFQNHLLTHRPEAKPVKISLSSVNDEGMRVTVATPAKQIECNLQLLLDGQPAKLAASGRNVWTAKPASGEIKVERKQSALGELLLLSYSSAPGDPVKYRNATLRLSAPDVSLYYMGAQVWSKTPVDVMEYNSKLQTRMAAMETNGVMVGLIPGTDRGLLGFAAGKASSELLLGAKPVAVLLAAVEGDWWDAYQYATSEVSGFAEQQQTVPVSEVQYGVSRYLLSDEVWDSTLNTVKSWPARDHHTDLMGTHYYAFYGAPYSIPAYWARYVMNGDKLALERCDSVARWLCRSGLRMKDGPARGAFFSQQLFGRGEEVKLDKPGCTQAHTPILTNQATGAALWSLLYYRNATGRSDDEIDNVIREGAEWLLKTQGADGSWPYGHSVDGKPSDGAPSGGSIWSIWSLWKLGNDPDCRRRLLSPTKATECAEAAQRATAWYNREFMDKHHFHGYWEDMGPNTREGYDAAVAAVAFREMGQADLVVAAARDAVQWVYTRQLEHREPTNSAGLVAEQLGWPPAFYCNPMMALAAHSAWEVSGDDFWKPFALIPKALGWWYQPESGAMVWIVESPQPAPIVGPSFESWWSDWCNAQVGSLSLRWLNREFRSRSAGAIAIDEYTLRGTAFGKKVHLWAPPGGLRPVLPPHGQVNWLGFRGDDCLFVAFANYGDAGDLACPLDSRDVSGATLQPKAIHRFKDGKHRTESWTQPGPVRMDREETIVLEFGLRM